MNISCKLLAVAFTSTFTVTSAFAAEDGPIKKAMQTVHKAPKTEKKLGEKIIEGTATDEEKQIALALYKAMADSKAPQGDDAAFKAKVAKLISATEDVVAKKPDAIAHYKEAVNCKACHSEHKPK
jgi:cytochrome c556